MNGETVEACVPNGTQHNTPVSALLMLGLCSIPSFALMPDIKYGDIDTQEMLCLLKRLLKRLLVT